MAITNTDKLPGVSVDIADGQLGVRRPAPGPKVTILATTTSTSLDLYEPVLVDNIPLALRAARHTDGSPSEMSLALAEAVRVGARSVELVKIATVSGELDTAFTPNNRFDGIERALENLKLLDVDVVVPVNAFIDSTGLSGTSPDGQTRSIGFARQLGNFCYQTTKEWNSCDGVIGVRPINKVARDEVWTGAPSTYAKEMFDDPPIAHLREWVYHLRGEAGTEVDHTADNLLEGYLAGSTEQSAGQISASYDGWAQDELGALAKDRNQKNVDGYAYLSVCAFLARISTDETQNLANSLNDPAQNSQHALCGGAVAYAAFMTTLDPHEATTNKSIPGLFASRKFSASLSEKLVQVRMVTMVDRSGSFVVSKDCTGGYNGGLYTRTDFTLLSTVRIMHAMVDIVRNRSFRYLGRPITSVNMAAMETDIRSGLEAMKPSGALQSYDLFTTASSDAQVLGEVNVELSAVIGYELTKVNAFTSLQKPSAITG